MQQQLVEEKTDINILIKAGNISPSKKSNVPSFVEKLFLKTLKIPDSSISRTTNSQKNAETKNNMSISIKTSN